MNTEIARVLACKRTTDTIPLKDVFNLCRKTSTRISAKKKMPRSKSLVLPYSILTDGHDIAMTVNIFGQFMIGTTSLVEADKRIWTVKQFDELVERTIKEDTISRFAGMLVEDDHGDMKHATVKDLDVVCTNRATRSIDFFQVHPFYMIRLKQQGRKCSIPSVLADGSETVAIEVQDILQMGLGPRLQYPCRAALHMFFGEEIELPEREAGFV